MLNDHEFENWCRSLDLSEQARKFVANIRTSPPARRVQSGAANVHGFYPSKKMGQTISFESGALELPRIYVHEHNESVLEFYDQPCIIKLNYDSLSGKRVGIQHTPDSFVMEKDSAGFEECKPEEQLLRLSKESPNRYVQQSDGTWRCPPGEEFAGKYGLYYRVISSTSIDWNYQNNIRFLEDYLRNEDVSITKDAGDAISNYVRNNPGVSLYDLIMNSSESTADDIYSSLIRNTIYIDLDTNILSKPKNVQVFINKETAMGYRHITNNKHTTIHERSNSVQVSEGSQVLWDSVNWTILNVGHEEIVMQSENGNTARLNYSSFDALLGQGKISAIPTSRAEDQQSDAYNILTQASPHDLEIAECRYQIVSSAIGTKMDTSHYDVQVPQRTLRRWIKKYREAQQAYGNGFLGLIPESRNKGNRSAKLLDSVKKIMNAVIETEYEHNRQIDRKTAFGVVINRCEGEGLIPPSYRTFCEAIRLRPQLDLVRKRRGSKAAYGLEPFYWYLDPTVPKHGSRPWEICHMDHTEIDLELVNDYHENLGRAYLSVLIDAYSRKILGFDVSFEKPSYRACMKVIRDCVRRYGRLPDSIVVDGGKEFHSIYFDALLAHYDCIKKVRPPAKPRFGSVIERLFGSLNTMLFHLLSGNTQMTHEDVRQVTKDVDPKRLANWTLPRLYHRLTEFFFEIYETLQHSTLKSTPRDAFNAGIVLSGKRPYRRIAYDQAFIMSTLPTTPKGTVKVDISRGVKVNYVYYWSDAFKDPKTVGTQLPVRYDPYDIGHVYVYLRNQWVRCLSEYYLIFMGHTERELAIATETLRKQNLNQTRVFSISAAKLAAFFQSAQAEEQLALQRARDNAAKDIPDSVANTTATTAHSSSHETSPPPLQDAADDEEDFSFEDIVPSGVYEDE